jgi:hypothetical protein
VGNSASPINVTIINNSSADIQVEQLSETEIRIIANQEAKSVVAKHSETHIANAVNDPNSKISRAINNNISAGRRR